MTPILTIENADRVNYFDFHEIKSINPTPKAIEKIKQLESGSRLSLTETYRIYNKKHVLLSKRVLTFRVPDSGTSVISVEYNRMSEVRNLRLLLSVKAGMDIHVAVGFRHHSTKAIFKSSSASANIARFGDQDTAYSTFMGIAESIDWESPDIFTYLRLIV